MAASARDDRRVPATGKVGTSPRHGDISNWARDGDVSPIDYNLRIPLTAFARTLLCQRFSKYRWPP